MSILTKVFVVLTLVFSLALAVFVTMTLKEQRRFVTSLQSEQVARIAAQAALARAQGQRDTLDTKVGNMRTEQTSLVSTFQQQVRTLQNQIAGLQRELTTKGADLNNAQASVTALTTANQAMTDTLSKLNTELTGLRKEVPDLTQKNAELNRDDQEHIAAVESLKRQLREKEEQLAQALQPQAQPVAGIPVGGAEGTPTLSAVVPINGKVSRVDVLNGRTYVTLSLGKRDGVQENFRFTLYRDSSYVGDAVVRRVAPDVAVAEVTVLKPGQQVQAQDLALSGPAQ